MATTTTTVRQFFSQSLMLESGLDAEKMEVFKNHPVFTIYRSRDGGAIFVDSTTNQPFWHTTKATPVAVNSGYGYIQTRHTKYQLVPLGLDRIEYDSDFHPAFDRKGDFREMIFESIRSGYTNFSVFWHGIHLKTGFGFVSIVWDDNGTYEIGIMDAHERLVGYDTYRHLPLNIIFEAIQKLVDAPTPDAADDKMLAIEMEYYDRMD